MTDLLHVVRPQNVLRLGTDTERCRVLRDFLDLFSCKTEASEGAVFYSFDVPSSFKENFDMFSSFCNVWCVSCVPVNLGACMRLKHNLIWCCEDRLWTVQSIREIDGWSLSSCWELHCTCNFPVHAAFSPALRGYLEKLQNLCQMRVREPREDWDWNEPPWLAYNTSSAETMDLTWCGCRQHCHIRLIWTLPSSTDVFTGVICQSRDLSCWLSNRTQIVVVRAPVYFQLLQDGLNFHWQK